MNNPERILIISSDFNLKKVLDFCFAGWGYDVFLWDSIAEDITPIKKISPSVIVVDVHSARKSHLEICRILKSDFITAFIPVITLIDKRQMRTELLSLRQGVDDYLIKPPDPIDLRVRIEMAIRRSQYSYYASPLTGLPGGRMIEEALNERLEKNASFSFGYLDLDNFKCFNDVYGYLKGDKVIMQTAYMLYTTICKFGNKDDFIGHIGGDDFVFITTTDRYKEVCNNFILMFDRVMPFHYSFEDRKNRFVIAKDRNNKIRKMALVSVSIAVVNKYERSEFKNIIQINERLTEIKKYLKDIPGSKYMTERRNARQGDYLTPQIYGKQYSLEATYRPLGQILVDENIISDQQLDEALNIHWKRGIPIGETLKELGFLKDEDLMRILDMQKKHAPYAYG